jgi:hypothetical protein
LPYFSLLLLAACAVLRAQAPATPDNPVAHVRDARSLHYGPFVNYSNGVGYRSNFHFLSAGFEVGKPLTRVLALGRLSGQVELAANVMPLWQAYTPAPHNENRTCVDAQGNRFPCVLPVGGGTYTGVSITPVIFRWNLSTRSRRIQPWIQGAGGLIYTPHKFPPDVLVPHGTPGGTSVWNFSPQGGGGIRWFTRSNRSIDIGVNGVHISSASLGDKNPGVNASIQIQVGYTFWR